MKTIYTLKINNSVVYEQCIKPRLKVLGYNTDVYISDFTFCPILVIYYDKELTINNINLGMYNSLKNNPEFNIIESASVSEFIENASLCNKPTYALF